MEKLHSVRVLISPVSFRNQLRPLEHGVAHPCRPPPSLAVWACDFVDQMATTMTTDALQRSKSGVALRFQSLRRWLIMSWRCSWPASTPGKLKVTVQKTRRWPDGEFISMFHVREVRFAA
ncbi:hypothetical protein BHE74_00014638 [Ensete ventricosum]|nr:hypothetical protein GW17_00044592 [Ensete ventricosum]RWW77217.1 hypothetical protein BHE74_00014638 [Ensete ventricosum]RZR83289.1 hypothetical protein BHM03_00009877 [Ensete ventricosum]